MEGAIVDLQAATDFKQATSMCRADEPDFNIGVAQDCVIVDPCWQRPQMNEWVPISPEDMETQMYVLERLCYSFTGRSKLEKQEIIKWIQEGEHEPAAETEPYGGQKKRKMDAQGESQQGDSGESCRKRGRAVEGGEDTAGATSIGERS
jgi:hypothetical protein